MSSASWRIFAVASVRQVLVQTMAALASMAAGGEIAPVGAFAGLIPARGTETNTRVDRLVPASIVC